MWPHPKTFYLIMLSISGVAYNQVWYKQSSFTILIFPYPTDQPAYLKEYFKKKESVPRLPQSKAATVCARNNFLLLSLILLHSLSQETSCLTSLLEAQKQSFPSLTSLPLLPLSANILRKICSGFLRLL